MEDSDLATAEPSFVRIIFARFFAQTRSDLLTKLIQKKRELMSESITSRLIIQSPSLSAYCERILFKS